MIINNIIKKLYKIKLFENISSNESKINKVFIFWIKSFTRFIWLKAIMFINFFLFIFI